MPEKPSPCRIININVENFKICVYNTQLKSAEVIKLLKEDGWFVHNIRGSHHQFKHSTKKGKVTVPHPKPAKPERSTDLVGRLQKTAYRSQRLTKIT